MHDVTGAERRAHGSIDRGGQPADADRGEQYRAILGDDRVEVVLEPGEHSRQLADDPSGDQDHPDPPGAGLGERGQRVRRDLTFGERAVVVERHRAEVPERSLSDNFVGPLGAAEREQLIAAAGVDHERVEAASPDRAQRLSRLLELQARLLELQAQLPRVRVRFSPGLNRSHRAKRGDGAQPQPLRRSPPRR